MFTKIGGGGRQQQFNPNTGKYSSNCEKTLKLNSQIKSLKKIKQENLYNQALKSKDPYLFEVFHKIERSIPYSVQLVNYSTFDCQIGNIREFDIVTKKCIIEIKSSHRLKKGFRQFSQQKQFAKNSKMHHVVFAPNISPVTQHIFISKGINVIKDIKELIYFIREHE